MPHTVALPIELHPPFLCWSDSNTQLKVSKTYDLPISLQHIYKRNKDLKQLNFKAIHFKFRFILFIGGKI